MRQTTEYRVRFDEATPRGLLRGSALLGYVQDVAWRHLEALGFARDWHREKGVAWLVRAVEARVLGPITDGETVAVTTRLTGYRKVMARRETEVAGPAGELRAVVLIDWAMTNGRVPVRIPAEFERAPIDGPGPFTPVRVNLPASPPDATALRFSPRPRELDPMNHANNGVYLDWLDEAVAAAGAHGDAATAVLPRTYRMEYLRPAEPGASLISTAWRDGPGWAYRLADADGADLLRGRLIVS
ncbi:MAG TPA: acyl-ACP thioesterase domain-containing protein [Candidatus Nanopelagicales bacterium]|nr:acyl-ACP thioesterase domain-containing protein [Candidatus Nanopelagicales bacterium]